MLIKRRDKIARAYLPKINPLTRFALADERLSFENAAVRAGVADAPKGGYRAAWQRLDNNSGQTTPIADTTGTAGADYVPAPAGLPTADGSYIVANVSAVDPPRESWTKPVEVCFRRRAGAWQLVGVVRQPEGPQAMKEGSRSRQEGEQGPPTPP